jgi:hypothetical protein
MTKIALIDSNKAVDDILMADDLERYANEHPEQFKLWHALSDAPEGWKYDKKRLDEDMMREHLFAAAEGVATFVSDPLREQCAVGWLMGCVLTDVWSAGVDRPRCCSRTEEYGVQRWRDNVRLLIARETHVCPSCNRLFIDVHPAGIMSNADESATAAVEKDIHI